MNDLNETVFIALFKEACAKCFGYALTSPLSETDSKILSMAILDKTGLVIGVKSIKNYSLYVLQPKEGRKENPSTATLDTLARYVLEAPYTNEGQRKTDEGHYPYWFQFRTAFKGNTAEVATGKESKSSMPWKKVVIAAAAVALTGLGIWLIRPWESIPKNAVFRETFDVVQRVTLEDHGWDIRSVDSLYWSQRSEREGHLALYTLFGDNWPAAGNASGIRNLVVRKIDQACFTAEVHFTSFIPTANWQQAGLLLGENDDFTGKVLRLSISYNDFFGGYKKNPEIIIQGLASSENSGLSKPEEFIHSQLFTIDPGDEDLVIQNMAKSALKIEKKGSHFRFLVTTGEKEGFAFREIAAGDYNIEPKYLALFAMQGFATEEHHMPVYFDSFSSVGIACE